MRKSIVEKGLPQHVFFPVVTGHCTEVLIDKLYSSVDQCPNIYITCAINTVEEHLLIYKQKMSHLILEEVEECYRHLQEKSQRGSVQRFYQNVLGFIESNGFDGLQSAESQIDFASFGNEYQKLDDVVIRQAGLRFDPQKALSNFIHADAVLQAAWNNIFDVKGLNIHCMAADFLSVSSKSMHYRNAKDLYNTPGLIQLQVDKSSELTLVDGDMWYLVQ